MQVNIFDTKLLLFLATHAQLELSGQASAPRGKLMLVAVC